MIEVGRRICHYEGCKRDATHANPGEKAKVCLTHKTVDMINVFEKKCTYPGCSTRPIFNIRGKSPIFCTVHKQPGMIDVKNKGCCHPGCDKTNTVFGVPDKQERYCIDHKTKDMKNVRDKMCLYEECDKYPSYNLPGQKNKLYCAEHKQDGMIDVKTKTCIHPFCTTRLIYGRPGNPTTHCAKNREHYMIRRPNGKCKQKGCINPAIFGGNNYTPMRCETHKIEDDLNLVERTCVKCGFTMVLDETNHCEFCNPEKFKRTVLAKQNAILGYLDTRKGLPTPLSTDKMVDGGACGKERPDRVYDLGDKVVVVECDEHQHYERVCECEQTRMVNIAQSFGGLPTYFLRWNPDDYTSMSERKIPESIEKRNVLLGDVLEGIIKGSMKLPHALASAIYLYYDDWDGLHNEEWKVLLRFDI
jgi:hypothetical protein